MFTRAVGRQLFGEHLGSVLAEIRTYGGQLVGQNGVVFGERVADYDRIENAKSADEQQRRRQRKEQNKLERDGTRVIALPHPRPRPRSLPPPFLLEQARTR